MENLENIKTNNVNLFSKLIDYNCKVTYNGKIIYEGKLNNIYDSISDSFISDVFKKYDQSLLVYDFNINENHAILLGKENKNIDKLNKLFENNNFNNIFNDAKLYNKAMNLANNLPLYNILENNTNENVNNEIKTKISKYGINFQKIYENLNIMKSINKFINEGRNTLSNDEKFYIANIIYLAKKCNEKDVKFMLDRFDDDMLDKFGEFIQCGIDDNKFDNIPEPIGNENSTTIFNFISDITPEEADNLIR